MPGTSDLPMRGVTVRRSIAAVLLAVAAGTVPAPAHATPMAVTGHPCLLEALRSGTQWEGILYSKPQKLSGVAGDPQATGTLTCTLKLNGVTHLDGGDVAATQSPLSTGVAVAPPVPVSFAAGDFDHIAICAQVDVVGEGTYYWHDYANVGSWSTDPDGECTSNISLFVFPPYVTRIFQHVNGVLAIADPVVCAQLGALAPGTGPVVIDETGDTYVAGELFWDCPPFVES
jgi:hypothetical protein